MLVILPVLPVSAPFEAMFGEQFEAQVLMIDLVREVRFAVQISSLRRRGRSHAVVNAIERCGKPDVVFHAVLRYSSVRNRVLDRNIPDS